MAHILLVDDDAGMREVLSTALRQQGHSVALAENGAEGLAHFSEHSFDLVVTDILMPDMDGLGMIAAMQEAVRLCLGNR